jgi:hypothetical protein
LDFLARLILLGEIPENDDLFIDLRQSGKAERCPACGKSVEEACFRFGKRRWHMGCFCCSSCSIPLAISWDSARYDELNNRLYCSNHAVAASKPGFEAVTMLEEYVFLLRCALGRLCTILNVRIDPTLEEPVSEKMKQSFGMIDNNDDVIDTLSGMSISHGLTEHAKAYVNDRTLQRQNALDRSKNAAGFEELAFVDVPQGRSRRSSWLSDLDPFDARMVQLLAVRRLEKMFVPSLMTKEDFANCIDTNKQSSVLKKIADAFKGRKGTPKDAKHDGTFGVPLEVLVERVPAKVEMGTGPSAKIIPLIICECIRALLTMDLTVEGIFRKNGNIRRLKTVSDELDQDPTAIDFRDDNPIQISALVKKFLRDLPEPLMTFKLHKLFVNSQKLETDSLRKEALHIICCLLPKPNLDLLNVIIWFFEKVSRLSGTVENRAVGQGNRMDIDNMAVVLAPNVLYSKSKNPVDDDSFLCIQVIKMLMLYQDEIWRVILKNS